MVNKRLGDDRGSTNGWVGATKPAGGRSRLRRLAGACTAVVVAGLGAGVSGVGAGPATTAPPTSELAATVPVGSEPADSGPATSAPVDSVTGSTESAPGSDAGGDSDWTSVVPGGECQCADGAEFTFFERTASPTEVVLFLEGGGACFSAETCAFTEEASTTYDWNIGADDDPAQMSGIFDLDNPANPFGGSSFVYVPYCTGDVHLGDTTREYSPELTVEHNGYVNGTTALAYLAETYPDVEQVVVVGESAGAIAAPLYGALVTDALPDAQVTVFSDGSGGYPDDPNLSAGTDALWGLVRPEWAADVPAADFSIPEMVMLAGEHDPDIVMSRFDYAYDAVQLVFLDLLGLEIDLLETIDLNEANIEAAGVDQVSFTAAGDSHTLVRQDEFYTMELDGVSLTDWLTAVVAGETVEDVHCEECAAP